MTEAEFKTLKAEDYVIDRHGNKVRICDINKQLKLIQVYGDSFRSYASFEMTQRRRGRKS